MVKVGLEKIREIQSQIERVRNICILAHVDHGKTTLADFLIASNGIISHKLAGKLRYMDSRPDEQERQITMKSSSISLYYQSATNSSECLINLIDSPGHVDFSSEVSTAVRLCDGAIIVVDVVEGVCAQTRVCLKQAYNENLKTVLFLNKVDRLILEKKMTTAEVYRQLTQIIEQVNAVIGNIFASDIILKDGLTTQTDQTSALERDESDDSVLYFAPENGNVIFGSAIDGWGFTIRDFAEIYAPKLGVPVERLQATMWQDYYYSPKKKCCEKGAYEKGKKPLFVQFILDNIWSIYETIDSRNAEKVQLIVEKLMVTVNPRDIRNTDPKVAIKSIFSQWLPLERRILESVIRHVPPPNRISDAKAEMLMCASLESFATYPAETQLLKEEFVKCDRRSENVIVFISKMFPVDRRSVGALEAQMANLEVGGDTSSDEVFIAFARIFSGTLRKGMKLYVLGPKYDPRVGGQDTFASSPHVSEVEIGDLFLLMGRDLQEIDEMPAGNIIGISGLQNVVIKTATLSNNLFCPPFIDLPVIATPILRVAVEPVNTNDMPKLLAGLKLLNQADACVQIIINETGEHVLLTLGEVHLERCIKDLQDSYAKIQLNVSKPIVPFRETIVDHIFTTEDTITETTSKDEEAFVVIQTANKQSTVKIQAVPLPHEVVELLDASAEMLRAFSDRKESRQPADFLEKSILDLKEKLQRIVAESDCKALTPDMIDRVWSVGPRRCGANFLLNLVAGFEYQNFWATTSFNERATDDKRLIYDSSFINGFQLATLAGPMAGEPMQGVCFMILEWTIESDDESGVQSHGPFSGQIMSAVKEGCKRAFQKQHQRLVSPMYSCNITVNSDVLGKLYAVIGKRNGRIVSADLIEGSGQFDVTAIVPVIESFHFAKEIRKQTSGLAMPQLVFSHWETIDIDPYWVPSTEEEYLQFGEKADFENVAKKYMDSIRERKGLHVEKKVVEFAEKQRTLSKNK